MRAKFLTIVALLLTCFALVLSIQPGRAASPQRSEATALMASSQTAANPSDSGVPIGCAMQPNPTPIPTVIRPRPTQVPLTRFRQVNPANAAMTSAPATLPGTTPDGRSVPAYTPKEVVELADPSNFGDRFIKDYYGKVVENEPIIVLHETVGSASSAINYFQTPHPSDDDQVSYHTLIGLDGTVYYLVPPDKRAFGAGNSVFAGSKGSETVKTHRDFPPSVNNFAYHISLETPADGDNNNTRHSGYTNAQYQSLAWVAAKTGVPNDRITYHKTVDRSGSRMDPRSFNEQTLFSLLNTYPKTREIVIGCSLSIATPEAIQPEAVQ